MPPPPPVLEGILAGTTFRRTSGEWYLEYPETARSESLLAAFLTAFPWVRVASVAQGDLDIEATLDIEIAWAEPSGALQRSFLPACAIWSAELPVFVQGFRVLPNVFTDVIFLYTPTLSLGLDAHPFDFREAAASNRATIATSLRAWGLLSGGIITACGSELIEGVTLAGFASNATAR